MYSHPTIGDVGMTSVNLVLQSMILETCVEGKPHGQDKKHQEERIDEHADAEALEEGTILGSSLD